MAGIERLFKDRQGRSLLPVTGSEQVYRNGTRRTVEESLQSLENQPGGGNLRLLFEAAGAVWNDETGFYEYGGLTDLTEEDMTKSIYFHTFIGNETPASYLYANLGSASPRVFLPVLVSYNMMLYKSTLMYNGAYAESIVIHHSGRYARFSNQDHSQMFRGCIKLKYVNYNSYIDVSSVTNPAYMKLFDGECPVEYIKLKGLKVDMNFGFCPNLRVEDNIDSDLGFLVENAANTAPITVTLHPDAYSRVPDSLKLKTQEKQISLVSV